MFNRILVPLDQSPIAECVLAHAASFAELYDAELNLIHVMERSRLQDQRQPVDPISWRYGKAEAEAYLNTITKRYQKVGLQPEPVLLEGQPAQAIIDFARSHQINLIMMSSHGKTGLSRWNINSVVRKIIQGSQISTFLVRAYNPSVTNLLGLRYKRLLVPLDGSLRSECVLPTAETLAQRHDANLMLGHVVVKPEIPRQTPLTKEDHEIIQQFVSRNLAAAEDYFNRLLNRLTVDFVPRIIVGENTAVSLHDLVETEQVDLVVISAHGFSGEAKWPFGSLTSSFIEYGTTPLLVVQDQAYDEVIETHAEAAAKEVKGH